MTYRNGADPMTYQLVRAFARGMREAHGPQFMFSVGESDEEWRAYQLGRRIVRRLTRKDATR